MSFLKEWDKMLGIEEPEPEVEAEAPVDTGPQLQSTDYDASDDLEPEREEDPDRPHKPDPFTSMIDSLLATEGVDGAMVARKKESLNGVDPSAHVWKMAREAIFADDDYKFRCAKCLKWVTVPRDSTIDSAVVEQGVNPNCAVQLVTDAMSM
jgi:hypothetical protein